LPTDRPRPDAALLERRALAYLQRYPASRRRLAAVLQRRAWPEARAHGLDANDLDSLVQSVVARLAAKGLVDDAVFAQGRVRALLRRGRPPARVRLELGRDGIDAEFANALLAEAAGGGDLEHAAAVRYARRRGLGPFRTGDRAARRERDLAALVRQGFPMPVARAVIDAEAPDDPLA
jgi:regulatory protein